MPTATVTMRQFRRTLHLNLQAGLNHNEGGRALKIFKSAMGKFTPLASVGGEARSPVKIAQAMASSSG
jgi:hypothetical protein